MLSDSKLSHLNCYFTLQDTKAVLISSLINCEHYIILKFTFLKEIFWGYFLEVKCCDSLKFMLYFLLLFFFLALTVLTQSWKIQSNQGASSFFHILHLHAWQSGKWKINSKWLSLQSWMAYTQANVAGGRLNI